jgi:hypothetical protein
MQLLRSGRSVVRDAPQESARGRGHVGMIVSPPASHKWWTARATDTTHHSRVARRGAAAGASLALGAEAFAQCQLVPIQPTGRPAGPVTSRQVGPKLPSSG